MGTSGSHYKAVPVGVDSTVTIPGSRVGGFIAATAGSIQFTIRQENVPDVVLPAVPLSAGQEWDIEFFCRDCWSVHYYYFRRLFRYSFL